MKVIGQKVDGELLDVAVMVFINGKRIVVQVIFMTIVRDLEHVHRT